MSDHQTFTDRVAELFKSMPGQWIEAQVLMQVGGVCAWRTRVSDARRLHGLHIVNRTRRVETPIGAFTVSEYAYMPQVARSGNLEHAEAQELPWS